MYLCFVVERFLGFVDAREAQDSEALFGYKLVMFSHGSAHPSIQDNLLCMMQTSWTAEAAERRENR